MTAREGQSVVSVELTVGGSIELVVTFAVRDLFVGRFEIGPEESPVGERAWYQEHGGTASG